MFYTTFALCVHFNIILPPVPVYVKQSLHFMHFSFSIGTAYFILLTIFYLSLLTIPLNCMQM